MDGNFVPCYLHILFLQNSDMQDFFKKTYRKISIVYRGVDTNEFYPYEKKDIIY